LLQPNAGTVWVLNFLPLGTGISIGDRLYFDC